MTNVTKEYNIHKSFDTSQANPARTTQKKHPLFLSKNGSLPIIPQSRSSTIPQPQPVPKPLPQPGTDTPNPPEQIRPHTSLQRPDEGPFLQPGLRHPPPGALPLPDLKGHTSFPFHPPGPTFSPRPGIPRTACPVFLNSRYCPLYFNSYNTYNSTLPCIRNHSGKVFQNPLFSSPALTPFPYPFHRATSLRLEALHPWNKVP